MTSVTDKKAFSFNEFLKYGAIVFALAGFYYKSGSDKDEIRSEIRELKAYINGDNKAGELRLNRLEVDNTRHENQIIMLSTSVAILQKQIEVPKNSGNGN